MKLRGVAEVHSVGVVEVVGRSDNHAGQIEVVDAVDNLRVFPKMRAEVRQLPGIGVVEPAAEQQRRAHDHVERQILGEQQRRPPGARNHERLVDGVVVSI